jgi:hypothetical protein
MNSGRSVFLWALCLEIKAYYTSINSMVAPFKSWVM